MKILQASLIAGATMIAPAAADEPSPTFAADFAASCPSQSPDWRVSARLPRADIEDRIRCVRDEGGTGTLMRLTVKPKDAYEEEAGSEPSERVEVQIRRTVIRYDTPVWYHFRFRAAAPWVGFDNRTVIHQIKQNLADKDSRENGGTCPSANPFLKIELRGSAEGGLFRVAKAGSDDCLAPRQAVFCGPWPVALDSWHAVHVALRPSQKEGASDVRVWIDGRACPRYTGAMGLSVHGKKDDQGRPVIDAQPRFGIYRDAIPGEQTIEFQDLAFWETEPKGHPAWVTLKDSFNLASE